MHIFLNGLAASAGAGLTYLHNVVPQLADTPGVRTTVAVQPNLRDKFEGLSNVRVFCPPRMFGAARRFWFEQSEFPAIIMKSGADVLLSTGNFAVRKSPVPQILLSGNSLYTSAVFFRDLWSRREYGLLADTFFRGIFAKKSIHWTDQTVAPTKAFADDLQRWTGRDIAVVHHGFDHERFFADGTPLSPELEGKIRGREECVRLLFVSHYNYYRNFETLFRALPLVQKQLTGRKIELFLTCRLNRSATPGTYDPRLAKQLIAELGIEASVQELGAVPYDCLHHLYRACSIYVTAAYAETFAHPLVEAMACGLPIVASNLPVHREVCQDAAVYFSPFAHERLADTLVSVISDLLLSSRLAQAGCTRAKDFSWSRHVGSILQLAGKLCRRKCRLSDEPSLNPVGNQT